MKSNTYMLLWGMCLYNDTSCFENDVHLFPQINRLKNTNVTVMYMNRSQLSLIQRNKHYYTPCLMKEN